MLPLTIAQILGIASKALDIDPLFLSLPEFHTASWHSEN